MKKLLLTSMFFSALALGLTGCLKDKGFEDHEYGINDPDNSPVGIGFPEAQNAINNRSIDAISTPQTLSDPTIVLFGAEPAKEDIHITLVANPALVTAYNTANGTSLVALPAAQYSQPTLQVVIPKGQRTGQLKLTFANAGAIDPTKLYAFGYTISSIQEAGYTIASNYKNFLLAVAIKNKYDGRYRVTGTFVDLTNAAFTSVLPNEVQLITSGPTSVTAYRVINGALLPAYLFSNAGAGTYYGNFGAVFNFNGTTNKLVSVTNFYGQPSSNGRSAAIDPSGDAEGKNQFFPADHSIKAKYFLLQPGSTVRSKFDETYTYLGPR
jgi:hypothetical protein